MTMANNRLRLGEERLEVKLLIRRAIIIINIKTLLNRILIYVKRPFEETYTRVLPLVSSFKMYFLGMIHSFWPQSHTKKIKYLPNTYLETYFKCMRGKYRTSFVFWYLNWNWKCSKGQFLFEFNLKLFSQYFAKIKRNWKWSNILSTFHDCLWAQIDFSPMANQFRSLCIINFVIFSTEGQPDFLVLSRQYLKILRDVYKLILTDCRMYKSYLRLFS